MPISIDPDAFYSDAEYCDVRGIKKATSATERSRGEGPRFRKLGKAIFYRGSDLIAFFDARSGAHGAEIKEKRRGAA